MFSILKDILARNYKDLPVSISEQEQLLLEEKLKDYLEKYQSEVASILPTSSPTLQHQQSLEEIVKKLQKENFVLKEHLSSQMIMMQQTTDYMNNLIQQIEEQNKTIDSNAQELNQQNEELRQYQEEILTHRDFIEEQNGVLLDAYKKISYSINAAQRIQQAILPSYEKVTQSLEDVFIIYRPKDTVSGDFYYFNKKNNKCFIAVADCTGHGIPGAFVSIIGSSLLDKIILASENDQPSEILYKLHQEVLRMLHQQEGYNRDGMDVALCVIEDIPHQSHLKKVLFAGAKRPLWYLKQDNHEIVKIKPTRRSIGGEQNENVPFKTQEIILPVGSILYMATDGFADQNDIHRKKIGENKLEEMLIKYRDRTLYSQKIKLELFLDEYKRGSEQRDDILLLGARI